MSEETKSLNSDSQLIYEEEIILKPLTYLYQSEGKNVRVKFMKAFNHWLQIPNENLMELVEASERLHNVSLLFDDIEDNSNLRRGKTAAHQLFGVPLTINAACYAIFLSNKQIIDTGYPNHSLELSKIFLDHIIEAHRGQGMELYWRDDFICPTLREYERAASQKTGAFFHASIKMMQVFSENKTNFTNLIKNFGLYFQIRDDYWNLCSDEYHRLKSFCEDITEGKFSFPIIHGIQTSSKAKEIINILKERTTDIEKKKYVVDLLRQCGSIQYTEQILANLRKELFEELIKLDKNEAFENMIIKDCF